MELDILRNNRKNKFSYLSLIKTLFIINLFLFQKILGNKIPSQTILHNTKNNLALLNLAHDSNIEISSKKDEKNDNYLNFSFIRNLQTNTCTNLCRRCMGTKCSQCYQGNYMDSTGTCQQCPGYPKCSACSSPKGTCTACSSGYTYNYSNASCTPCQDSLPNCSSCMFGYCIACNTGYYLFTNKCLACPDKCSSCTSLTRCTGCKTGILINYACTEGCSSSDPYCMKCSSTPNTCIQCITGFYLNSQGKCSKCPDTNCSTCDSTGQCVTCKSSYTLQKSDSNLCVPAGTNCANYNTDLTCNQCKDGYILDSKKSCMSKCNDENCQTCDANGVCQTCKTGFVSHAQDLDILCVPPNTYCAYFNYVDLSCTKCQDGFILATNTLTSPPTTKCVRKCDDSNCLECDISTGKICTKCSDSFILKKLDSSSTLCTSQYCEDSNCLVCDKLGKVCSTCMSSYKLQQETNSTNFFCVPSIGFCKTYNKDLSCIECITGYSLNSTTKSCIKTCEDTNCKSCDPNTGTSCSSCKNNYQLFSQSNGSLCVPPNRYCSFFNKDLTCGKCNEGFYAEAGRCKKICSDNNCQECEADDTCTECKNGFSLPTSLNALTPIKVCKIPVLNCESYFQDLTCEICDDGFYLDYFGSCSPCEEDEFSINNICIKCKSQFGPCRTCSRSGCQMCMKNAQIDNKSYDSSNYNSCECERAFTYLFDQCIPKSLIYGPAIATVVLIILAIGIIVYRKRKNKLNNVGIVPIQNNRFSINNGEVINIHNHVENNNHNLVPELQPDEVMLRGLTDLHSDHRHSNQCVFGDRNPPFWKLNCGGYVCNNCSMKVLTSLSEASECINCPKCTLKIEYFNYVNRVNNQPQESDERDLQQTEHNTSIQKHILKIVGKIDNQISEESKCNICFYLTTSKKIHCKSTIPHMLCSYCYKRLIIIEKTKLCPFCRTEISNEE
jgi:hypothetical protein